MDVLAIQTALKGIGVNPGPLDGIWGRQTIEALKQFQRRAGLEVDGLAGPKLEAALFAQNGASANTTDLVWMKEARRLMGVKEVAGGGSNADILDWAKNLDLAYGDDDVPWCGLFVSHCVGATLPSEPLPANPLGARNWLKFGQASNPVAGAILVFWRGSKAGWLGHVGFYVGEDHGTYSVLGGNQSNRVSIARIGKDRLLEARWPRTAAHLRSSAMVRAGSGGAVSVNEA